MTVLAFSDLMTALSTELNRLSRATERMHDLVCFSPEGRRRNDSRFVEDAQSIDHTVQVLGDLARFMMELAGEKVESPSLCVGRALQSLRLAELKCRLAPGSANAHEPQPASGDCELF